MGLVVTPPAGVEVGAVSDPQDSVTCWECEGSGFLSDAGVIWDCAVCEGGGFLSVSILEQKSDEVLHFYYGTTDAREAFERLKKKQEPIKVHTLESTKNFPGVEVEQAREPIIGTVKTSTSLEVEPAQEAPQESNFGRIVYPRPAQKPIVQTAKNSPGVDLLTVADAWNPADFGEVLHKSEPTGQLNLLEWEDTNEPPDPDDYHCMTNFHAAYDAWLVREQLKEVLESNENNDATARGTGAEPVRSGEVVGVPLGTGGSHLRSQSNGARKHDENERLGSQNGESLLERSRNDSGDLRGALPHQSAKLTLQAPIAKLQAPNATLQAPSAPTHLKVGMEVGHKTGSHLGEILKIYYFQKRRKWRAKVGGAAYDLDNLVEQRVLPWDFPKPLGRWQKTGSIMRCSEACDIWTCRQSAPTKNWTLQELVSKPIWQLKAIALEVCEYIPGSVGKRSLIRAIVAEQIFQGRSDEAKPTPVEAAKLAARPAAKPTDIKTINSLADTSPQQLSLNLFPVAS